MMNESLYSINVEECARKFIGGHDPKERVSSFDYCYNYFQDFREANTIHELASHQNIEKSCLQLAFYLASWGMLRGSTVFLTKSAKWLEPLIKEISELDSNHTLWNIDVPDYHKTEAQKALQSFKDVIIDILTVGKRKPSDILVTKIMLGVFGNVPALDSNFQKCFGVKELSESTLLTIQEFYIQKKTEIDSLEIKTIGFGSGAPTKRYYSRAKIVDMIGFVIGLGGA